MKQSEAKSQYKICKCCHIEKPLSAFRIFNDSKQHNKKYYSNRCDDCYKDIENARAVPVGKVCNKCGIYRTIDRYNRSPTHKDGYRGICKDCLNQAVKIKRLDNVDGYRSKKNEILRKHRHTPRGAMRQRFQSAKRRAKQLGLSFDLTLDFLMDLFEAQDGKCALTGLPLHFTGEFWDVLSIDRKIPDEGYTKSNVQLVVNRVNAIKGNLSMEELLVICRLIIEKGSETISKESTLK